MTSFGHLPTRHRHAQHHDLGQVHGPSSSGKVKFSIPDLRFEQSYLLSLQRFIHHEDDQRCLTTKGEEKAASGTTTGNNLTKDKSILTTGKAPRTETGLYGVPLRMDWGGIIYVTIRNQILSPFAQGAVLAIFTVYLQPFLRTLGAHVRTHVLRSWLSVFPPIEPRTQGGAGWMRKQLREFSVGRVGANFALGK